MRAAFDKPRNRAGGGVALNALLEDEFEIHERLAALDRKLELAARTEQTLVDLISTNHALRVEWYIVALILFEILLTLYGMFGH